jgi:RNA polymerase sigma-70 factor (ECF subfamily)
VSADDDSSGAGIERLYEQHGRVLLAYACSFVHSVAEGEDVVHQVFTRLLRGDLVITGRPLAYLCRAIRNTALNQRRTWHRETALDDEARWLQAPAGLEESAMAIERSMNLLPVEQREVVVLHIWGGLTFAEIADTLSISANTAASRYRYALGKLREALKPLGEM